MVPADDLLGAMPLADGRWQFLLWAPRPEKIELHLWGDPPQFVALEPLGHGYYRAIVDGLAPGQLYCYRLNQSVDRPDPASRLQPRGIHGPSQLVPREFAWHDEAWPGRPPVDYVIYELHVGTFTPAGTFAAAIDQLDDLAQLGVTAIELMPVAQFPGGRNWGYDGVHPFAVQNTYGGPLGMKAFVDACHARGLAVVLDVVYNHLGPEGNYLAEFGPYFNPAYQTPWGPALNFDGPDSDQVRRFFLENALGWITEFHVDGLRLDAIHGIVDQSAHPFLAELGETIERRAGELGRPVVVIAESNTNDPRTVATRDAGGYGLDAQWLDDFGLSLHSLLTGERDGCYRDYQSLPNFAKAYRDGFILSGQYSHYRRRRHGTSSRGVPAEKFVSFLENHDQVGNRQRGTRLSQTLDLERIKLGAAAVLLSPYVPLIFMGEEYAETAPFHFFVSHLDPGLVAAVRAGRLREMVRYQWHEEPADPGAASTFEACRLNHALRDGQHRLIWNFYQQLLKLRKGLPAIRRAPREQTETSFDEPRGLLVARRWTEASDVAIFLHFGGEPTTVDPNPWLSDSDWRLQLDTADRAWNGPGSRIPAETSRDMESGLSLQPWSCLVLERQV